MTSLGALIALLLMLIALRGMIADLRKRVKKLEDKCQDTKEQR